MEKPTSLFMKKTKMILYKGYLPDEAIMKDLFKSLLDRNPKFIHEEEAPKNTRKIPRTKKNSQSSSCHFEEVVFATVRFHIFISLYLRVLFALIFLLCFPWVKL